MPEEKSLPKPLTDLPAPEKDLPLPEKEITAHATKPEKSHKSSMILKSFLLGILFVILIVVIGGGTFYYKSSQISPTPSPRPKPAEAIKKKGILPITGSISEQASIPGWITYTDYQYNFSIEHPNDVVYFRGRFILKKYLDIYLEDADRFSYIGIPAIKFTTVGLGDPKKVYTDAINDKSEIKNVVFKDFRSNNIYGAQILKDNLGWDIKLTYFLTSNLITPLTFEFSSENAEKFSDPKDSEYSAAFSDEDKQKDKILHLEGVELDEAGPKMLSTLKFLDVNDQAENWNVYKTGEVSFKYPNHFLVYEKTPGLVTIESDEDGDYEMNGYQIDTRLSGTNSDYNSTYSSLKEHLSGLTEKNISGFKVLSGFIPDNEAEKFLEDINIDPDGIAYNQPIQGTSPYDGVIDSDESDIPLIIALVPSGNGAIVVYLTDKIISENWLDEILENIKVN